MSLLEKFFSLPELISEWRTKSIKAQVKAKKSVDNIKERMAPKLTEEEQLIYESILERRLQKRLKMKEAVKAGIKEVETIANNLSKEEEKNGKRKTRSRKKSTGNNSLI